MKTASLIQMSGVVVDLVYRVDAVPKAGQEAIVEESMIAPGGGFNAMVAASRAGVQVTYGGSHGTGRFADITRSAISDLGIPILQQPLDHCDQGTCVVLVDRQGERTFISQAGAERYFGSNQFKRIDLSAFEFVLISGYTFALCSNPDILEKWLSEFPDGPRLIFDPSPVVDQIPSSVLQQVLSRCTWISANSNEATSITGNDLPGCSAETLCELISGDHGAGAVVRNGAEGCWLALPGQEAVQIEPYKVDPIDTNGAGDAHIGSFIAALGRGDDPEYAAHYANAAAALSTLENGPATAPKHEQTLKFMKRQTVSTSNSTDWQRQKILYSTNI